MTSSSKEFKDKTAALAYHFKKIIEIIGDDPSREGLLKTPERAAKAMLFATQGYEQDAQEVIRQAIFEDGGSRMVVVKDIEFYSFCEHHILPFFGKVSIGYIPDGKMVGLSKLARLVNVVARRLQVQERLTSEICDAVNAALSPKGVIVVCRAEHLCMKMRGVEKQDSSTVTISDCGLFAENPSLRSDFFEMLRNQ
ncbi:MAG: GTP cyclohydrolase I FolE [Muribaculaceae bacterium]|nr:GTP cyclohydrolase I FolE [Muribaculaceae bacterium]